MKKSMSGPPTRPTRRRLIQQVAALGASGWLVDPLSSQSNSPASTGWREIPPLTLNAGSKVSIAQFYLGADATFATTLPLPPGSEAFCRWGLVCHCGCFQHDTRWTGVYGGSPLSPPPSPPAIVLPPIPAPVGLYERRATPGRPNGFGGAAKHLRFCKVGSRWYKVVGDHARTDTAPESPSEQGGRQEIHSVDLATNDWRMEEPYWPRKPAGSVALFSPDDGAACTVGDEIWVYVNDRNSTLYQPPWTMTPGSLTAPAGCAQYFTDKVMAWKPATKTWRVIGNLPPGITANRAWHAELDPPRSRVLVVSNQGNDDNFLLEIDAATGVLVAQHRIGDKGYCHKGGLAMDVAGRKAYVWETTKTSGVIEINLDSYATRQVAVCPEPPTGTTSGGLIAGPTRSGKLLCFGWAQLHILSLATGVWQTVDRQDGFVSAVGAWCPCVTAFYDADLDATCTIGAVDWDRGQDIGAYFLVRA